MYLLEDGVNESLSKESFLRMLSRRSCLTADIHTPDCGELAPSTPEG